MFSFYPFSNDLKCLYINSHLSKLKLFPVYAMNRTAFSIDALSYSKYIFPPSMEDHLIPMLFVIAENQ